MNLPKKQGQRLIPEYLLKYNEELHKNHPDPSAEWGGGSGGTPIEAGNGIEITGTDTKTISIDDTVVATKSDIPENYVTTDTQQNITASKTFTGSGSVSTSIEADGITVSAGSVVYSNLDEEYLSFHDNQGVSYFDARGISRHYSNESLRKDYRLAIIDSDTYTTTGEYTFKYDKSGEVAVTSEIPTNNNQLTNGAGYITGITSNDVTTALGYTPGTSNFSGDYTDLTNKPDLSVYALSANLATVATTGDYDDLINKPTIPTVPVRSDNLISVASGFANRYTKVMYDQQNGLLTLVAQWYNNSGSNIAANTTIATIDSSITVPFNQYYYPGLNQGNAASIKLELATGGTIKNIQSWTSGTTLTVSWVLNIS